MKAMLVPLACWALAGAAWAKLPPPTPEAAAKAAESAARAKWSGQVDGYRLCLVQDRIAARFGQPHAVDAAPLPPCLDPGPFAYTPPAQKPIEASGAHSPPGTATNPPSTGAPTPPTAAPKS